MHARGLRRGGRRSAARTSWERPSEVVEKILFQHEIFGHDRFMRAVHHRRDPARGDPSLDRAPRPRGRACRRSEREEARAPWYGVTALPCCGAQQTTMTMSQVDRLRSKKHAPPPAARPGARRTVPTRRPTTADPDRRPTSRATARRPGGAGSSTRRSRSASARTPRTRPTVTRSAPRAWRSTLSLGLRGPRLVRGRGRLARERRAAARRICPSRRSTAGCGSSHALAAMFAEGDLERAVELFDEAYELGKRVGDRDVQMLALSGKGRAFDQGRRDRRGPRACSTRRRASAMCGDLRAHSAGLVYCITISSCQDLGDYRRAAEWTEAANRWCDKLDVNGFPGRLPDPSRRGAPASRRLAGRGGPGGRRVRGAPRLRPHDHRGRPLRDRRDPPSSRRLRGRGGGVPHRRARWAASRSRASRSFGSPRARSTRPWPASRGRSRTRTIRSTALRSLPAQVEIAIAAGDLKTARAARRRGRADRRLVQDRQPARRRVRRHRPLRARSDPARREGLGRRPRGAPARRDEWQDVGAPYETARARMLLGTAYTTRGRRARRRRTSSRARSRPSSGSARRPDEARVKELLGRVETRRTFLFTDIVDSTKLLETLGDDKWKRLLARHDELVRERIVEAGGEVVKQTGDGFFASFENPKAAIDAAVAIQRALARRDRRAGRPHRRAFRRRVPH